MSSKPVVKLPGNRHLDCIKKCALRVFGCDNQCEMLAKVAAPVSPDKPKAPHVPAAFINAIAEEGTKAEAVQYLQEQWNENRQLESALAEARELAYSATGMPYRLILKNLTMPSATRNNYALAGRLAEIAHAHKAGDSALIWKIEAELNKSLPPEAGSKFIPAFKEWYERDGSVGGLSSLVEDHEVELKLYGPGKT